MLALVVVILSVCVVTLGAVLAGGFVGTWMFYLHHTPAGVGVAFLIGFCTLLVGLFGVGLMTIGAVALSRQRKEKPEETPVTARAVLFGGVMALLFAISVFINSMYF